MKNKKMTMQQDLELTRDMLKKYIEQNYPYILNAKDIVEEFNFEEGVTLGGDEILDESSNFGLDNTVIDENENYVCHTGSVDLKEVLFISLITKQIEIDNNEYFYEPLAFTVQNEDCEYLYSEEI